MLTPFEQAALWLSIKVSLVAIVGLFPITLWLGWLLARKTFTGKALLSTVVHLPLVVPPVVIGYVLLITLGPSGFMGQLLQRWFDVSVAFNWKGAAVASAIVSLPLMVRALRTGFEYVDPKLEIAARSLGASRLRVFCTITFPLCIPAMISAFLLGFSRALGEFGATITFVANIPGQTQTIPLAIYQQLEMPGGEWQATRLCVLSVLLACIAVGASEYCQRWQLRRVK
ncbi:molybdate ABC transporter permease subunit [Thaumasiovibrio subtropicus]|uniref:molybdate ABC transporter permease subunit n=1 Tax=Thaumasiovibrio subtropicus TaxID=1891207 RepID=UPI000B358736|nr:molybdate ABC transporter permease subunit [Thaumasiovibrio subtropicus]